MIFSPKPIDTSGVELPPDLTGLLEVLAEHNHDVWARQRIADGWTYGPKRDDTLRHHPDLVPYADLAETEKQYDRNAAAETLKAIIACGYRITRSRDAAKARSSQKNAKAER